MSLISGRAALAAASTLSAQATPPQERPETLARLMACRGIAENTARLACFDTAAGALDSAERQGDLVVIDRAGVAAFIRANRGRDIAAACGQLANTENERTFTPLKPLKRSNPDP